MPDPITVDPSQVQAITVDPSQVEPINTSQNADHDALSKVLNYHTGNKLIDAPLGFLQGAAKGAISTVNNGSEMLRHSTAMREADDAFYHFIGATPPTEQQWSDLVKPSGIGQGTGKFVEQAAEYAVPASRIGTAVKLAPLALRAGAQAAGSGAVAALQSRGDPASTVTGAVMGGGGELAAGALAPIAKAVTTKFPTLANFADSFANATPTQKARINSALPTLIKDGVQPEDDPFLMQETIKNKLADLSNSYKNLPPQVQGRIIHPDDVIQMLQDEQKAYMRKGVVTDETGFNAIQDQINKVKKISADSGYLELGDLVHLKGVANNKTNFTSPDVEKTVWKNIGDVYRSAADKIAPETTQLNHDYQKYKDLEQLIDQNIARGKANTPSGLTALVDRGIGSSMGASVGAGIGHLTGIPGAPEAGAAVGALAGGKLNKPAMQAVRNLSDSGMLEKMSVPARSALQQAVRAGNNDLILKIAGGATKESAVSGVSGQ